MSQDAARALQDAAKEVQAEEDAERGAEMKPRRPSPRMRPKQSSESEGTKGADESEEFEATSTSQGLLAAAAQVVDPERDGNHEKPNEMSSGEEDDYNDDDFASEGARTAGTNDDVRNKLLEAVATVNKEEDEQQGKSLMDAVKEIDQEEELKKRHSSQSEDESGSEDESEESDLDDELPVLDKSCGALLLRLAYHGKTSKAKELLKAKAKEDGVDRHSVNGITDRHGWTPLHWAASRGHVKFCQWLIHRGAHVNAREETNDWTPLHLAAVISRVEIAHILLEEGGASARRVDRFGDIPHECVCRPLKGQAGDEARELRKMLRPVRPKEKNKSVRAEREKDRDGNENSKFNSNQ